MTASLHIDERRTSADGATKLRLRTNDGHPLEAVLMRFERGGAGAEARTTLPPRFTACLSSQSGCALSCTFCATGRMKLGRSLTRTEIVEQFAILAAELAAAPADGAPTRIDNVVMMGMGEPLHNYDEVLAALAHLADQRAGFGVAPRRMTLSTVGWVPGIERLAADPFPVRLALSLHASNDEVRERLMPVNRRYRIDRLLDTCADYCARTRRGIFVEYLLLAGVNDHLEHASELAALLTDPARPLDAHVNLIAYNPAGTDFLAASDAQVDAFREVLRASGIPVSYRVSRARDIAGACGQLSAPRA